LGPWAAEDAHATADMRWLPLSKRRPHVATSHASFALGCIQCQGTPTFTTHGRGAGQRASSYVGTAAVRGASRANEKASRGRRGAPTVTNHKSHCRSLERSQAGDNTAQLGHMRMRIPAHDAAGGAHISRPALHRSWCAAHGSTALPCVCSLRCVLSSPNTLLGLGRGHSSMLIRANQPQPSPEPGDWEANQPPSTPTPPESLTDRSLVVPCLVAGSRARLYYCCAHQAAARPRRD
jgi:hypothetical protein